MRRLRLFPLDVLHCIAFMAMWIMVLSLTGCDTPAAFQAKYPKDAVVIEDVIEFAEKLGEGEAEHILKLPDGSLQMIFDHKLFVVPAATVAAAEVAGVSIPEASVSVPAAK